MAMVPYHPRPTTSTMDPGDIPLATTPVLVVDCQTTSSRPRDGQIMEIAWSRIDPRSDESSVEQRLVRLREGMRIPRAVTRITGLEQEQIDREGVDEHDAWTDLIEAAGPGPTPTVIHYAPFERAFLRDLAARHGPEALPFDIICTHAIAKRLLPDLPRHTLRALAGYFGHGAHALRRAGNHVEATAFVWRHLVRELAARDVHTWSDAHQLVASKRARRSTKKGVPLPRETRLALPDAPGIYRFVRRDGSVLYVGKAISLKRRVNSYFSGRKGQRAHTQEMLTQAADVEIEATATALEASLLETDRIKELSPPYNVQLLDEARAAWFASTSLHDLSTTPDAHHRLGPFPSRWPLEHFTGLCQILEGHVREGQVREERVLEDDALGGDRSPPRAVDRPRLRARAVAEAAALGPTADELAAGLALFQTRYPQFQDQWATAAALLHHGKHLAELDARRLLDPGETGVGPGPRPWDPERVARHVERVVLQAGRSLRRARWLCLLSESTISFQEPHQAATRMLRVSGGQIVERGFVPPERPLPIPSHRSRTLRERQAAMNLTVYDRLRVLSTELKRLCQHSDDVRVRIGHRPPIAGKALQRVLLLT